MTIKQIEEFSGMTRARVCHPWRRYFARGLDFMIYSIIWSAVRYLAFRWSPGTYSFVSLLDTYITFGIMLIIEPILLATLGTTPGKWIFGLQVRGVDGRKLSFYDALSRTWMMFHYGYGYSIPFYNLYRIYQSYKICVDSGELQWDEDNAYTIKDLKIRRIFAFIMANILLLGFAAFIVLQADMPRHRGDLTAEEFSQNFNDLMDYKKFDFDMHLDSYGKWVEDPPDNTIIFEMLTGLPLPDFEITETNGDVTKVFFEISSDTPDIIYDNFTNQINLAIMSYLCAQKEINFISQLSVLSVENTAFTSFEFTKAGITVRCHVEYEGYRLMKQYALFPIENEKQYYHLEFSMKKTV